MATLTEHSTHEHVVAPTSALDRLRDHISQLSFSFVNTINAREWDSQLWNLVAPNFTSKPEALSGAQAPLNGREAFIKSMQNLATTYPEWKINVEKMEVTFNDVHTSAEVFTHSLATGEPVGIARPAMTRLEWKLIRGKWWFVSHEILPGPGVDVMGLESPYQAES